MEVLFSARVMNPQRTYNTVIFVESTLYVFGISQILNVNNENNGNEMKFEKLFTSEQKNNVIYICNVKYEEMEKKAKQLLSHDQSLKLFIIKNNIEFNEVKRLIQIGVKGICSTDIDENYLLNAVNQVHNGHIFIEHHTRGKIIKEYLDLIEMNRFSLPLNDTEMKKKLTRREIEIIKLLARGYTNIQIGKELFISDKTVKNHISNILEKLEVTDRLNAVLLALRNNWIHLN